MDLQNRFIKTASKIPETFMSPSLFFVCTSPTLSAPFLYLFANKPPFSLESHNRHGNNDFKKKVSGTGIPS
ncbi:hypothetical protein ACFSE3_00505 [Peribacillus frigoritolerans]|uniref:hypothetical protein n=1 Tax=Peribacillus frigoritolerans TaxID=450367 RepID=UPI000AE72C9A|nr:hypothetical protein [Peribacillus frigoritolerans]